MLISVMSVRLVQVCLELSIFIFLGQRAIREQSESNRANCVLLYCQAPTKTKYCILQIQEDYLKTARRLKTANWFCIMIDSGYVTQTRFFMVIELTHCKVQDSTFHPVVHLGRLQTNFQIEIFTNTNLDIPV